MMRHIISSERKIRNRKLQWDHTLLELRLPLEFMLHMEEKDENKEMSRRMVSIQHITLNDMANWQSSLAEKVALPNKDIT